jgi:uncharacterized protein (DUF924 family)
MTSSDSGLPTAHEVVQFWQDAGPQAWFEKNPAFDTAFAQRFLPAHHAAARRELEHWLDAPEGALALMILLDQLPRNAFRDSAHSYATDSLALHYAHRAVAAGHDLQIVPALRTFLYLPFGHSEDPAMQARSVDLFTAMGDAEALVHAVAHQQVIARFGRFPHRNRALGRENTAEEQAWLDAGGGF